MPYVIEKLCSGSDIKCMEVCPFDCIYVNKDELSAKPPLYINPEECTDCGACALACPESAIVPAAAYGRYAGPVKGPKANPYEAHLSVAQPESEINAFEVIAKEWTTAFIASQP
jgi:NAD-dependent dihydropyrimidine dehydrogenase PreA subunit